MMSNDDNDSIQQSLPLSWEDSEAETQEPAPPKKLLLRREDPVEELPAEEPLEELPAEDPVEELPAEEPLVEATSDTEEAFDDEWDETAAFSENTEDDILEALEEPHEEQIRVQKPLLLKKVEEQAARLNEDDKATVIDDRFYGKSQLDVEDFSDYEDDAHLDSLEDSTSTNERQEINTELEDESSDELENQNDHPETENEEEIEETENESGEISEELENQNDHLETENEEEIEEAENESSEIGEEEIEEAENESGEISEELENQNDHLENEAEIEEAENESSEISEELENQNDHPETENESSYLGLEKENSLDDESSENKETSAFADTGTFTLDDDYEEPEVDLAEEDENRLSIPEDVLDDFEEEKEEAKEDLEDELKSTSALEDAEEKSLSEKIEAQQEEMTAEESVFALKADTYYDHTDIESTKDESSLDSQPVETPEDAEVFQHEDRQSLGELLQEARLACSFTIKDAAEATRIKSSYIISLESNEFHELPAKVYILNYIRQLCREYNIAHEPVISQYEKQADVNNNGEVKVVRVGDEDARRATKPHSKLNTLVVGSSLLVFGILLFAAWTMQWFGPSNTADAVKDVEINLIEVRSGVKLPSPELPVPTR